MKAIGYGAAGGRGNKTINKRIRNNRQILLIIVLHSTVIPVIFLVSVITRYQIQPVSLFFGRYCCTVSFGGNFCLRFRGKSFFEKFRGNIFFSSKGG